MQGKIAALNEIAGEACVDDDAEEHRHRVRSRNDAEVGRPQEPSEDDEDDEASGVGAP